jgi:nucleotide-binding universal stress UspA family protein
MDQMDKLRGPEEAPAFEDSDGPTSALRMCEEAGVVARMETVHAMAVRALREHCVAMDMLVLGRRGTVGRREIGNTASSVVSRPIVPTLLCRDTVVPWGDVLVAYEATPTGGRALKAGAQLASDLNASLDVVIADPQREQGRRSEAYVSRALRAFHVEGHLVRHETRMAEALQRTALEYPCSVLVAPAGRNCPWPWSKSEVLNSALNYPGAMALVVP